jgi:hypothetical protein
MFAPALAASLLAVQPSPTALTVGTCAAAALSQTDRAHLSASVHEGSTPEAAVSDRLVAQLRRCAGGQMPPEAVAGALAEATRTETRRELRDGGVDTALLERWFEGQSEAVRTDLSAFQERLMTVEVDQLTAMGLSEATLTANAKQIGGYAAALIVIERLRRGMSGGE